MSSKAKRVALLARPGSAGQRLSEVLDEAGVEIVLQADPTEVSVEAVLGAQPDTLLVALDAPTEDALDRLEAVLYAPRVDVIYEEAALVVAREGWDEARWRRHLLAKLQGHGNVLPPTQDGAHVAMGPSAHASPAAPPPRAESPGVAAPVPPPASAAPAPVTQAEPAFTTFSISQTFEVVAEPVIQAPAQTPTAQPATEPASPSFSSSAMWTLDPGPSNAETAAPGQADFSSTRLAEPLSVQEQEPSHAPAFSMGESPAVGPASVGPASVDPGAGAIDANVDAVEFSVPVAAEVPSTFNAFDPVAAELSDAQPGPEMTGSWADQAFVTSSTGSTPDDRFGNDLASLELRIASMSLADEAPVRGAERVRGAVLVMAGIGGPDAVRQLLGGLPTDFVRPVLVQQRLDGARYDRLVAQMQRATSLPVRLAEPGQRVEQGTVYILPDSLGIGDAASGLTFQEGATDILAALPAADSAVLMLSGSDPAQVDAVLSFGWNGGLVVAQNVDGCYDAAAVTDLAARGGSVAKPGEMGGRLAAHWQRGG